MSVERSIVDASALLACILDEPVTDALVAALDEGAFMSAANHAEVVSRLIRMGASPADTLRLADRSNVIVVPLTEALAEMAGELEPVGRSLGLSLADRCCLVTARAFNATAYTADRAWLDLPEPWVGRVRWARPG